MAHWDIDCIEYFLIHVYVYIICIEGHVAMHILDGLSPHP